MDGEDIRRFRRAHGWTQEEFCKLIGRGRAALSAVENSHTRVTPSLEEKITLLMARYEQRDNKPIPCVENPLTAVCLKLKAFANRLDDDRSVEVKVEELAAFAKSLFYSIDEIRIFAKDFQERKVK